MRLLRPFIRELVLPPPLLSLRPISATERANRLTNRGDLGASPSPPSHPSHQSPPTCPNRATQPSPPGDPRRFCRQRREPQTLWRPKSTFDCFYAAALFTQLYNIIHWQLFLHLWLKKYTGWFLTVFAISSTYLKKLAQPTRSLFTMKTNQKTPPHSEGGNTNQLLSQGSFESYMSSTWRKLA